MFKSSWLGALFQIETRLIKVGGGGGVYVMFKSSWLGAFFQMETRLIRVGGGGGVGF